MHFNVSMLQKNGLTWIFFLKRIKVSNYNVDQNGEVEQYITPQRHVGRHPE